MTLKVVAVLLAKVREERVTSAAAINIGQREIGLQAEQTGDVGRR